MSSDITLLLRIENILAYLVKSTTEHQQEILLDVYLVEHMI